MNAVEPVTGKEFLEWYTGVRRAVYLNGKEYVIGFRTTVYLDDGRKLVLPQSYIMEIDEWSAEEYEENNSYRIKDVLPESLIDKVYKIKIEKFYGDKIETEEYFYQKEVNV